MGKSESKKQQKKKANIKTSKGKTKDSYPRSVSIASLFIMVEHIVNHIDLHNETMSKTGQQKGYTEEDMYEEMKYIHGCIDETEKQTEWLCGAHGPWFTEIAREILITLNVLKHLFENTLMYFDYIENRDDLDLFYAHFKTVYRRANEHRCSLEILNSKLELTGPEKKVSGGTKKFKEVPWDKNDPDFILLSNAVVKLADNKIALSTMSKKVSKGEVATHMRHGQRRRVKMSEFHQWVESVYPWTTIPSERLDKSISHYIATIKDAHKRKKPSKQ